MIVTNRNRRCSICKGREVLGINERLEEVITSSLHETEAKGVYICNDMQECQGNVNADNTEVTYGFDDKGNITHTKVTAYGKTLIEVSKK